MEEGDARGQVREDVALQFLHLLGRGPDPKLVRLLDQRADDKDLPPGRDLSANEVIRGLPLIRRHQSSADGRSTRRHFVEHRDVQITEQGEPECSGDGGRGHREKKGPEIALADGETLTDAKAVLLVDHGECDVLEPNVLLDHGMGADQQVDGTVRDRGQQGASGSGRRASQKHADHDSKWPQQGLDDVGVLPRQDLGRRQQHRLEPRTCHVVHGHRRHHGLP